MRNIHILLFAAAALLPLAGCLKEPGPADGELLRMQVEPSMPEATKSSLTEDALSEFYLRVVSDDPACSYFVQLSKDTNGDWVSPTPLYWKGPSASVDYAAAVFGTHAFAAADFASGVSVALTLPADQSTQERLDAADLVTAPTATKAYSATVDGALPVAFQHALAKVSFTLTLGPAFYEKHHSRGENPVKDFTVKGTAGDFGFEPSTGKVTAGNTPVEITPLAGTFTASTLDNQSAKVTYEAIVVPKIFDAGTLKVTFRVGDYDYAWTNSELLVFSSGLSYEIPVSASTAPIGPNVNGHEYVTMCSSNANGKKILFRWATCNLGAENPWDSGNHYAWGETTPKNEFKWDNYLWRQAGAPLVDYIKDGEYIFKYSIADQNIYGLWYEGYTFIGDNGDGKEHKDFASYDYADDPARQAWGSTWRTPTLEDWMCLAAYSVCEWKSNYLGSGKNGLLFISTADGYEGESLFFPAAGYWDGTDWNYSGSNGYYWLPSVLSLDLKNTMSDQYCLVTSTNNGSFDYLQDMFRYMGLSIRPILDY